MSKERMRVFEDTQAVRSHVPLMVGIVGPSGSGKTYSALELATGMQDASGGEIFLIDTETGRAKFYADHFRFRHVDFAAPFSPLDYRAAFEHCVKQGAKTIIVDSFSHEHDGPGGVLEMHEAEVERRGGGDKHNLPAWAPVKKQRKALITWMTQARVNFILCFRAKEKIKMVVGKPPIVLGWQPIAGPDYIYELALNCLLLPGSRGVPIWNPSDLIPAERQMVKLPEQFLELFADGPQLSRAVGAAMATWAAGGQAGRQAVSDDVAAIVARAAACDTADELASLKAALPPVWKGATKGARAAMTAAMTAATDRVRAAVPDNAGGPSTGEIT